VSRLLDIDPELERELLREHQQDHFQDECGVVGVAGHPEAANIAYLALYALQHRGQESTGIATMESGEHRVHRAMGMVADVYSEKTLAKLPGRSAVGHVRYSTAGGSQLRNAQPFCATTDGGPVAIAHNGNLTNALAIRRELEGRGAIFSTTADSEVIGQLLARARERSPAMRLS
jgi:amidophosphoribosyltransferase